MSYPLYRYPILSIDLSIDGHHYCTFVGSNDSVHLYNQLQLDKKSKGCTEDYASNGYGIQKFHRWQWSILYLGSSMPILGSSHEVNSCYLKTISNFCYKTGIRSFDLINLLICLSIYILPVVSVWDAVVILGTTIPDIK